MRFIVLSILLISPAAIGCSKGDLSVPDEMIVYSLDHLIMDRATPIQNPEIFQSYPVWGKVEIKDKAKREELVNRLNENINRKGLSPAACFWPRHGVRLKYGNQIIDYEICFQCSSYRSYQNGKRDGGTIGGDSQELMDDLLKTAGVKLASKEMPPKE